MGDRELEDELRQLTKLISFHESGLAQHRFTMAQSAQTLEEMTIKALKELQSIKASSSSTAGPKS